jgi:hypothetical protein
MKVFKGFILSGLLILVGGCASPSRALYDTANTMYGGDWTYLGTLVVHPEVLYSDKITAADQTREVVLHEGLITYEKMLFEARQAYGDSVTIANIRIYKEEFKTKWFGRTSEVQALVDVIYVKK